MQQLPLQDLSYLSSRAHILVQGYVGKQFSWVPEKHRDIWERRGVKKSQEGSCIYTIEALPLSNADKCKRGKKDEVLIAQWQLPSWPFHLDYSIMLRLETFHISLGLEKSCSSRVIIDSLWHHSKQFHYSSISQPSRL